MEVDQAPVIGEPTLLADELDAPHWEALHRGELLLQRCESCQTWIWGPRHTCPSCHAQEPSWVPVEPEGVVYSWTRTWHAFAPEFANHLPYVTVLVELPHAGNTRVLGLLVGEDGGAPAIGDRVRGVFQSGSDLTAGAAVLRWERLPD